MISYQAFQAVIMAGGKGSRMTELTAEKPKCLLPVGNLPLLWYPLQLLERTKFQETIVVVSESVKNEIQNALEQIYGTNKLSIKIDFVGIPSNEDWGTADSLRYLYESNKIKHDVVVVSCDLITDVNLTDAFKTFRKHSASFTALLFANGIPKYTSVAPGRTKVDKKHEKDIIGVDPATSRLVFIASASDYDEDLPMSQVLLRKHGKIQIHSKLLDAHLYIMKHWVCKYLALNKNITTIKGELLPFIVKKQTSRENQNRSLNGKTESDKPSSNDTNKLDINHFAAEEEITQKIRAMSSWNDHTGDCYGPYHGDHIRCYAFIEPESTFGCRVNTIPAFCYVNKEIKSRWSKITCCEMNNNDKKGEENKEELKGAAKDLVETCLIDEKSSVSTRCHIISTNIASGAVVEPKSKISNCIVMSGVKIGEKCDLKNCIFFDDAIISEECSLTSCIVGKHYLIKPKEFHQSKVLTEIDHLMEI